MHRRQKLVSELRFRIRKQRTERRVIKIVLNNSADEEGVKEV